jgi:molecular chaperone Hsp33
MIRALTLDGAIRVSVAATTTLVEEIRRRQQTDPTASVAIGRLATAAALMGSLLKGRQRIGLTIEGNGPLQRLQAEADARGLVRATLKVASAGLPPRDGRFDVAGAVGQAGFLHVVKDLDLKEPYRGTVQLVSSEIAEDLAYYFTTSEQTPSSVALGVELGQQAEVITAGGLLLQLMPEADNSMADRLTERLTGMSPTTTMLSKGLTPEAIAADLLEDFPYQILGSMELRFSCSCSQRQTLSLLRSIGSVTCEYCKEVYTLKRETLQEIRASL